MLPACLPFLDIFSDFVFHRPSLPVEPITWMETFVAVSTEYLVQFYGNRIPCLTHVDVFRSYRCQQNAVSAMAGVRTLVPIRMIVVAISSKSTAVPREKQFKRKKKIVQNSLFFFTSRQS